jgi:hypothetical protein
MELTDYQRDILIRTALGEAAGEGKDGMAAVLHVILNRANSGQFPSDPADVALQNKQFSTWNKGAGGNNPQKWSENSKSYRTAAAALDGVLSAKSDPTGGALYYHAKGITPYWADDVNKNGVVKIGAHRFYPSHPVPKSSIPDVASATDFGPGIPTPLPAPRRMIASNAAWQPPSAAQTAAEQRLTRPDYRSLGFVPLPSPAPLRPAAVAQAGVGTPNLTTRKVNTVPVDNFGNPIIAKAALPPAPKPPRLTVVPGAHRPTDLQRRNMAALPAITSIPIFGPIVNGAVTAANLLNPPANAKPAPVPPRAPTYPPTTVRAPTLQEAMDEQAMMRRIPTAPKITQVAPKPTLPQLNPATLPRLPMPKPAALSRPIVPVRTAPIPAARIPLPQARTVNPVSQIIPAVQARAGQGIFGQLFNMLTAGNVPQANTGAPAAPGYNGSTTVTSNDLRPTHSSIFSDNALLPSGMNNRRWAGDGY